MSETVRVLEIEAEMSHGYIQVKKKTAVPIGCLQK